MKPVCSILITMLSTILVSCGSSPPVRYYSLEAIETASAGENTDAIVVGLGPLRMPEYLKRPQMVTRGSGAEVKVHEFARWAEPVDKAMHRVIAADVESQLDGIVILAYPYLETIPVDFLVLGQVDRFDSDASGRTLLQIQWTVLSRDRETVIPPRRARYETRAASPDDPGAIAMAMNEALKRFSKDVADQLRAKLVDDDDKG